MKSKTRRPKAESCKKCLTKNLDGRFSWECAFWYNPNQFFASFMIKSAIDFFSEAEARKDMADQLWKLGLDKVPIQKPT